MPTHETATPQIEAHLRIPGTWEDIGELAAGLPKGYTLRPGELVLPDGSTVEFRALPADDQFPTVFAISCRQPPEPEEIERIDNYLVNFCLMGDAGDRRGALRMMSAAAAILHAGGAGVFVDNGGTAHGASEWLALCHPENQETGPARAFVNMVCNRRQDIFTVGMHVLGHRDVIMPREKTLEEDADTIGEIICALASLPVDPTLDSQTAAREWSAHPVLGAFEVTDAAYQVMHPEHAMFNPFGRWLFQSRRAPHKG